MNKEKLDLYIECQDHTVTGETFELYLDKEYDMLYTFPKPEIKNLHKYYQSKDYISHTDAKRSLFEKLYHLVKRYALNKKVRLISKFNDGPGTLLDIGAGTGDFLCQAQKGHWLIEGVEPNAKARILAKEKGITLQTDTTDLSTQSFDMITMWHVLEHVSDIDSQIKELKRLLKPDGYIIIAVPNFKSYDAKHYGSFWAAYDVPRHLWHFSENAIIKFFEKENIILEKTKPLLFDSFYVSLLSEKYKTGRMHPIKASWIGFLSNLKGMNSKQFSSHIYILKNN